MNQVDDRITLAREYLAEVRRQAVTELPPSVLMRECAELRHQLHLVLAAYEDGAGALGEVRTVLAAFDWEHDDRQYALERIDRIAGES
jgi:hypothetical protein